MFPIAFVAHWIDLVIVGVIIEMAARGVRLGLFRAILLCMTAIACPVAALTYSDGLSAWLVRCDISPVIAHSVAFLLLIAAPAAAIHRGLKLVTAGRTVRLSPAVDGIGGGFAGAVAGVAISGTALIVWSMLPLPASLKIDTQSMALDVGETTLRTFARCVEHAPEARGRLLYGEPSEQTPGHRNHSLAQAGESPPWPVAQPSPVLSTEVFADLNLNSSYDEGEPFLDEDNDEAFSPALPFNDTNSDGRRDIGLLQRYRLGSWDRATSAAVTEGSPAPLDEDDEPQ